MKKLNYLLFTILSIVLFMACKPKEKLVGKNEKQTKDNQLVSNDTVPANYAKKEYDPDVVKHETIQQKSIKDTTVTEKIPLMNPKIHDMTNAIISTTDESEPEYDKYKTTPQIERAEISNFNPFLEKMYPGAKWWHDKYDNIEYYVNDYRAIYKGTEFSFQAINSFVYYFYDIGEISNEDMIKTAIYWIIQPEHPDIIITETKLTGERDFNKTTSIKIKMKDYTTICKVDNKILEVYTIIEEDKLYNFKAKLNNRLFCNYGSFY